MAANIMTKKQVEELKKKPVDTLTLPEQLLLLTLKVNDLEKRIEKEIKHIYTRLERP